MFYITMILPNLNYPSERKFCSEGTSIMVSTFKVSAKWVQPFLNIGLKESRFFPPTFRHPCLALKTCRAPSQRKLDSRDESNRQKVGQDLSLQFLCCPFTWSLESGKIKIPNLCKETQTHQECLSNSLMLNEYLLNEYERCTATSKGTFHLSCHQL